MPNLPDEGIETNSFFVDLYRTVGEDLLGVEAREHTAQVPYDLRLDREDRFRRAELPVLYCSPTMELGVDIAQLNVVNMRNVPPTPANYAQRSGRAGRSGQPALVFTYCSAGSSHDQHFFRQPELMVAGQVEAPRLELANEDLLRAHVHAVWLAESGLDLGKSMTDVLDLDDALDDPKVFPSVQAHLDDAGSRARANQRSKSVLSDLEPRLREAPWWSDTWLDDTLNAVPAQFGNALYRWRSLYRSALQQAREQSKIKQSASQPKSDQRKQADRLRRQAESPARPAPRRVGQPQPVRLLHLPLLRRRGLPARLLVPPPAAVGVHPRPARRRQQPRVRATPPLPGDQRVRPAEPDLPRGHPLPDQPGDPPGRRRRRLDRRRRHHPGEALRELRLPPPDPDPSRPRRVPSLQRRAAGGDARPVPPPERVDRAPRPDHLRRGGTPAQGLRDHLGRPLRRAHRPPVGRRSRGRSSTANPA